MSEIVLYEFTPSRSLRVRWALLELDLPFESISDKSLFGSDQLRDVQPLGKLPAITHNGRPLFESAAICTWLADSKPDAGLISKSGTWDRALHDQWVSFVLTEIEAHIWSTARNTFIYPEERRVTEIFKQNDYEARKGLDVLNQHLALSDYLVGDSFSVTDIIAGFATNWSRRLNLLDEFENVRNYNARLLERPLCPLSAD